MVWLLSLTLLLQTVRLYHTGHALLGQHSVLHMRYQLHLLCACYLFQVLSKLPVYSLTAWTDAAPGTTDNCYYDPSYN